MGWRPIQDWIILPSCFSSFPNLAQTIHCSVRGKRGLNKYSWHIATTPLPFVLQQIIQRHAIEIAKEYKTEAYEWQEAAKDLRQPYWDWAKPGGAKPPAELTSKETLRITLANERKANVNNPFRAYNFRSKESVAPFPKEFNDVMYTVRDMYADDPISDINE
jgi:tyrosinase